MLIRPQVIHDRAQCRLSAGGIGWRERGKWIHVHNRRVRDHPQRDFGHAPVYQAARDLYPSTHRSAAGTIGGEHDFRALSHHADSARIHPDLSMDLMSPGMTALRPQLDWRYFAIRAWRARSAIRSVRRCPGDYLAGRRK